MMKHLLSLKHLCCQAIAMRLWWNPRCVHLSVYNSLDYRRFEHAELARAIAQLGLPKTLETELLKIGISMVPGPELCEVTRIFHYLNDYESGYGQYYRCHPDSSVVSLNPTGGIKYEETIVNILQQPQVKNKMKFHLARHFTVFDPLVSGNYVSYIGTLSDMGFDLLKLQHMRSLHAKINLPEFFRLILCPSRINIWYLKHAWKILSQDDIEQFSGNLNQSVIKTATYNHQTSNCDFVLDNLFTEKIRNFWKLYGSEDPIDKFCFNNQLRRFLDYLASPFYYLDQKSTDLVKQLMTVPDATLSHTLCTMIDRIVFDYDNVLYGYLHEIWHGVSDSFKENFCKQHRSKLYYALRNQGYKNLDYVTQILLLLMPFDGELKANMDSDFIGCFLTNVLNSTDQFRTLDNYLQTFIGSKAKIADLKKRAISLNIVRDHICEYLTSDRYALTKEILQWAFESKKERSDYIMDLISYRPFLEEYLECISSKLFSK